MIEIDHRVAIGVMVAAAIFALIYWLWFCYKPASTAKTVVKTVSVALLALASVLVGGPWWLTAALCACALGDYLLALDRGKEFLVGVGAFALGHLFYIGGILSFPLSVPAQLGTEPIVWIVAVLICLAIVMAVVLFRHAGEMRFAVVCYVPVIAGLGVSALSLAPQGPVVFALFGAMCFLTSDFVLALEMFVLRVGNVVRKATPFVIWGTYWSAQLLLLLGLALPVK
ncbi:lysoplasmalogenase [Amylibacter sp.]|nr:lysoplasmalogenase [Amylibacter sp.]